MANTPNNTWFGISMFLLGGIIFYGFAVSTGGTMQAALPAPSQVADQPTPSAPAPTPSADEAPEFDADRDHVRGSSDPAIVVFEYSDLECPFCGRHHPTMQQLVDDNDDVAWVYRHFPLSFHPNATPMAEASECVWQEGGNDAFWAFIDMTFERGADASKIAQYADEAGVDGAAVQDCVDAGTFSDYVADDMARGSREGVSGTPGNIVMNLETGETRLVSGAQPVTAFQAAVDALR